jgi:hypothetical protein
MHFRHIYLISFSFSPFKICPFFARAARISFQINEKIKPLSCQGGVEREPVSVRDRFHSLLDRLKSIEDQKSRCGRGEFRTRPSLVGNLLIGSVAKTSGFQDVLSSLAPHRIEVFRNRIKSFGQNQSHPTLQRPLILNIMDRPGGYVHSAYFTSDFKE